MKNASISHKTCSHPLGKVVALMLQVLLLLTQFSYSNIAYSHASFHVVGYLEFHD